VGGLERLFASLDIPDEFPVRDPGVVEQELNDAEARLAHGAIVNDCRDYESSLGEWIQYACVSRRRHNHDGNGDWFESPTCHFTLTRPKANASSLTKLKARLLGAVCSD